jgi:uncharacterized protein (TIGR00730 family)
MSSRRIVTVFGSSASIEGDAEYEAARWLGAELGRKGWGVATGGYGGTMEAVSAGAAAAGSVVIGVTVPDLFTDRSGPNRFVSEEIRSQSLGDRIQRLLDLGDHWVALPGSIGTAAELVIAWNHAYISDRSSQQARLPIAVGSAWRSLAELLSASAGAELRLIRCVGTVGEIPDLIGPVSR